jgi:toxin ParE1/3/4
VKPAIRSALADADIDSAVDFYLAEAPSAASAFIDALERATRHVEAHPGSGSPRYALELNIPELRFWPLGRFPYALFYIEHPGHVQVIRCVHTSRDIPPTLREEAK